jgi:hypothetical protein
MIIHVYGLCAHLDPVAADAFVIACGFLNEGSGVCLSAAAARYLGDVGSLSTSAAESAFSALEGFLGKAGPSEIDWALEGLSKVAPQCSSETRERIVRLAGDYLGSPKPARRKRAEKLIAAAQ